MKTAMRVVALLPVVLLLGIVGIKMSAGDPSSPLNKVPGVQTIYELGNEAPSADVTLPPVETPTASPTDAITALPTDLTDALTAGIQMPIPSMPTTAPKPLKTTSAPAPVPAPDTSGSTGTGTGTGSGGGGGGDNPAPKPTTSSPAPAPSQTLTAQQQCVSRGGIWLGDLGCLG